MLLRDEVVEREREKPVLLPPLPEPDADETARPDGNERLPELVADFGRRAPGIEERDRPQQHIVQPLRLVPEQRDREHAEQRGNDRSARHPRTARSP